MASQGQKSDRRIIYCRMCHTPHEMLTTHLARVCMKTSTPEERQDELQRAKESTKKWTHTSRLWDYKELRKTIPHRPSRVAIVKELMTRDFYVLNAPDPQDLEISDEQPSTSTAALPLVSGSTEEAAGSKDFSGNSPASVDGSSEDRPNISDPSSDDGSIDPAWQRDKPRYTTSVRINMQKSGLYEKFPPEAKLLYGFKDYLINVLNVHNCQQEVDNVSRMLRFMQPTGDEVTIDFLEKSTETMDFLKALKATKMGPVTVLNYIKNMIRFVEYLTTYLNLEVEDPDFKRKCTSYTVLLKNLRKPVAKSNTKATCSTRYERFHSGLPSVRTCQKLLDVAKKDMQAIFGKLLQKEHVAPEEKTLFRYYCEAILVLKHFQRPGAVEGMTATEWVQKKEWDGRFCVGIKEHKTATMQIATFALDAEDATMLDAYYVWIRPEYINQSMDNEEKFFVSSNGTRIRSVTNDLHRLHVHYNLQNVTSQTIRSVETEVNFTDDQKAGVAHYMAHSTAVAKLHYRMKTMNGMVTTGNLLSSLGGSSSDESGEQSSAQGQKRTREEEASGSEEDSGERQDFSAFVNIFPVTLNASGPTKKQRLDAGFSSDRVFYDKWRSQQRAKRAEYIVSKSTRGPPSQHKVDKISRREGWGSNVPSLDMVKCKWTPTKKIQVESDRKIMKMNHHTEVARSGH